MRQVIDDSPTASTGSGEEAEEELDEEAQLMASMGLPLAFGSTSRQRSEVSWSALFRSSQKLCLSVHWGSVRFRHSQRGSRHAGCHRRKRRKKMERLG